MKRVLILLLAVMLVFSLASCSPKETETETGTGAELGTKTGTEPEIYVGKDWSSEHYNPETMKGVVLNLYGVTDVVRPILDVFEEDTGIKVEHLTLKNAEILQRLINEFEAGVSIADIWFTGGADTFINAAQNGLLIPYKSPHGAELDDIMKDAEGYWHGTSLTIVNWVVNKELIEQKSLKMPETWEDLLQEGLKGEVAMPNPASSGTGYNTISAIIEVKGEEEGWAYLEKLIEQVSFFSPRGSDPAQHVVNGEAIVGINPTDGGRELEINNPHIALVYPEDGTGWWPQPVAIVNGTKNEEAAKVFVDWLLSKRGMETIARERYAAVARQDVERPEGIVDISTINLFATDFQLNAERRDEILAEWEKRVSAAAR